MFNNNLVIINKNRNKIVKSLNKKKYKNSSQRGQIHPYHLVDISPWPILSAFSAFSVVLSLAFYSHFYMNGFDRFIISLIVLIIGASIWWRDVVREATFEGLHTFYVITGLKKGMVLFILSEVMLFFAFFWGFFHSSLNPTLEIGSVWPPIGIEPMDTWGIPLLNTIILLTSGATVTWAHYGLVVGYRKQVVFGFIFTVIL